MPSRRPTAGGCSTASPSCRGRSGGSTSRAPTAAAPDVLPAVPELSGTSPVWSSDSQLIAYVAGDGIHVVRRDGSSDRLIGRGEGPQWAPKGRTLAFLRDETPGTYPATVSAVVWRGGLQGAVTSGPQLSELAWSPDGSWLALAGNRLVVVSRTARADEN